VGIMRRRGEDAVIKGREEVKAGQRVLGWMDVESEEKSRDEEGETVGMRDVPEG